MQLPIEDAVKVAESMLDRLCSVQEWADEMGFDDSKLFSRAFRKQFGLRPSKYLPLMKVKRAEELLRSDENLKHFEIARQLGLQDEQAFYKFMKYHTGHAPSFFKKNNHGLD